MGWGKDQRIKDIMIAAILILAITTMTNVGVASAVTTVSSCGTLSTPGETYILNNDITTTGTCFTITADGLTLDGDGHTITGSGHFHGVLLSGSTGVTIKNLTVKSFGAGISLVSSNGNTLTSNTISNNDFGIWLFSSSSSNTLTSNTVSSNSVGIMLDFPSSSNTLTSNTVSSNRVGIDCNGSDGNTLTSNTISNNAFFGIRLFCFNNQIYNNSFINNPTQASVLFGRTGNVFNLAAPTGGNYWSNYDTPAENCNDTNNDGFCDAPFTFSGGQDNLPWTTQNGWVAPADITHPIITVLGSNPASAECGSSYNDAGATAQDDTDGDITSSIVVGGLPIDTSMLGSSSVTYDVSDSAGNAAATATRTVNVVDTTAPTITATLVPFGSGDDDEGMFIVSISATDICDPLLAVTANLNGVPVTNGQPVKLEIDDETESKTKSFTAEQCAKFQEEADKKTAKGKPIPDSLQFKLLICEAGSVLQMEDSSFTLTATATDASGNSSIATSSPTFVAEDDD